MAILTALFEYVDLNREDLLGDLFYAGMLGYYAQFTALSNLTGQQQGGHTLLLGGLGTHGYEPRVNTLFGFPRSISPGGVVFDIPIAMVNLTDGLDPENNRDYQQQIGQIGSSLEHAVLEQFFSTEDDPADAISTMKALSKANAEGQRIYQLNRENIAETLPNLNFDSETERDIEQALRAGLEVTAHTDPVNIPGWTGAGYMVSNPVTGSGAYLISGGMNGGNYSAESVALVVIGALGIWGVGGAFTLSIVGVLAALLAVSAIIIGLTIFISETIQDPSQVWEERDQIIAIIAFALIPVGAVLTGTAAAPGLSASAVATTIAQQIWALVFDIVATGLGLLGLL